MLTSKGRVFWESLQPKIYEFYRQALASFRFDDKVSLVHFLNQLNKGMDSVILDEPAALDDSGDSAVPAHESE